ncbi:MULTISPECIES: enoyl-CoA hydratase [Achromobacter]|uniref:Enoyl-CoA hydratase n=1 Tax=Achromobacter spanius TaxID=217203 RepID=A0ABY8GRM5_9BURK|nr:MULTISPECIES: enoyl-CoA hydratase [Achromobacter]WAI83461.1 enoyl-CoA hydratase [Achromobacter spanius]WEX93545.1 enoyl-CoA hydratase [Achromobacter sp. SS2-2022]WFP07295.1 enoyl-CoA hydratase [Achromobacter spanius]
MSQEEELIVRHDSGVLWLTLNRPERRNALSPTLYETLLGALEAAGRDPAVGAVVLAGSGGAFCAGGDVARMNRQADAPVPSPAERVAALRARTRIVEHLHGMSQPTIAMVRGAAVGAGLSLALACDLRYGDASARLRTGFADVGVPGDFGGHYFLPRIVGPAKARELYLRSPMLSATQALELGLLNEVFDADRLEDEVGAIARALAAGPQPALGHIKANLNDGLRLPLSGLLDRECARHVECVDSSDHKEAVRAFMEKRSPEFHRSRMAPGRRAD